MMPAIADLGVIFFHDLVAVESIKADDAGTLMIDYGSITAINLETGQTGLPDDVIGFHVIPPTNHKVRDRLRTDRVDRWCIEVMRQRNDL